MNKRFLFLMLPAASLIVLTAIVLGSRIVYPATVHPSEVEPIFLIPGTHASSDWFDAFSPRLHALHVGSASVLKVEVSHTGVLSYAGAIDRTSRHPFIAVGFADNNENDIDVDARWLDRVIRQLRHRLPFIHFQAIGHSNGGLILTLWLENDSQKSAASLTRMVAISTPFNGIDTSANGRSVHFAALSKTTPLLKRLMRNRAAIPKQLALLNIAGHADNEQGTDGVVPVQSVLAARLIFKGQIASYTENVIESKAAEHVAIIQQTPERVLNSIQHFLYVKKVYRFQRDQV
ncbi:MAG: alpha/beta hydrolase [Sporolactobacillus sp.]